MKKMGLILVILLLMETISFAFQNEPDGFRGIKWGTELKDIPDMVIVETKGDDKFCKKSADKMAIGAAEIKYLVYGFYKDRLSLIWIEYQDYSNFSALKDVFFAQYGSVSKDRFSEEYMWAGTDVVITLKFQPISEKGIVMYVYYPLLEEKKRDKKERGKQGADDL